MDINWQRYQIDLVLRLGGGEELAPGMTLSEQNFCVGFAVVGSCMAIPPFIKQLASNLTIIMAFCR